MWGLAEMRARYVSIAAVLLLLAIGPVMSPPAASYVYKEHRDNSTVPPPGADEYDPLIVLVPILKDDRVNYEWHASQPLELTVLRPDGYILVNPEVGFQGEGAFIAPQTGSYRFI